MLSSICTSHAVPELADCSFRIACDVTNPLCGELGCSAVYGPPKGATPKMVEQMDAWLNSYASLVAKSIPTADANYPGTGEAGSLGYAFMTFLHVSLESGIKIVLEETRVEDYVKEVDLVVTGEGRLDGQTAMGKAPVGVAKIGKKYGNLSLHLPVL